MRISVILFSFLLLDAPTFAQTHHALTGSRYAGSLGMYQNPASTLSSADTTDLSIANLHLNNYTNYINSVYAPLLSKNPAISIKPSIGDYPRELITNLHLNLLSFKHKLNQKTAFGFGINLRSMININTSHYHLTDSTNDIIGFIEENSSSLPFSGSGATSNWLEYVGNFSQNIIDNRKYLFNIGANIRMNRGLAGVVGSLGNFQYRKYNYRGIDAYEITNADFMYGISTTLASWNNTLTFKENFKTLRSQMKTGASLDIGTEILIKDDKASDWFYEGLDYNYRWKIGLSLIDLGFAKYEYFSESAISSGMKQNITPEILIDKFFGAVTSLADFNDSIATVVEKFEHLKGNFNVYHPARLNTNIDYKIHPFIFINAALSLPVSLVSNTHYVMKDIAYVSLTPRFEKRNFGMYLPISYNTKTTWNVGAALRAGPIMLGINDLHVFNNKTDIQNIGTYVSFLFHFKKHIPKEHFNFLKCTKKTL
jgi:hypothetical protein